MQTRSKKSNAGPAKAATVKVDDPQQSKLFIEKAREIGADEDKSAADKLIGQMAKTSPEPRKSTGRAKK